jgi:hypothetical protein
MNSPRPYLLEDEALPRKRELRFRPANAAFQLASEVLAEQADGRGG